MVEIENNILNDKWYLFFDTNTEEAYNLVKKEITSPDIKVRISEMGRRYHSANRGSICIGVFKGDEPIQAVKTLYGVELMQDNVDLCKDRIRDVLRANKVKITKKINDIIDHNFVCSDFFKWDFENWCSKETQTTESGLEEFFE